MTTDIANDAIKADSNQASSSKTLRITLIALIAILSCYYLWVLYKAVTPNVSIAYKAYYIKNQTLFWQPKQPTLALTIPSSLDMATKVPYLSRAGWEEDTDNNARLLHSTGGLYFTVPKAEQKNIHLTVSLSTPLSTPLNIHLNQWTGVLTPTTQANTLVASIPYNALITGDALQHFTIDTASPIAIKNIDFSYQEGALAHQTITASHSQDSSPAVNH
ncbi:riboflavin synthase subunit alpha [Photobacterium leiognathi]|uniref:riboflavin synthase subunit alpha n=1 Tax=Photobacterium leiognathi TaxID=553611 RepID=UPI00298231AF|nr:riboflavin synthase subunit alpha [Photobacterium leiognathi]